MTDQFGVTTDLWTQEETSTSYVTVRRYTTSMKTGSCVQDSWPQGSSK